MIEAAKYQANSNNVKVNFKVMDAIHLDFPSESFQNVFFSFNGFEHIPERKNREKVVRQVWEILKPDGCFILTARSGLAIGRRSIAWVLVSFEYFYQRFIKEEKSWEFGDKVWKNNYIHYINPFKLKTLVLPIGYEIIYFNSLKNIDKKKAPTFFTNFSNDKTLFYILRKKQNNIHFYYRYWCYKKTYFPFFLDNSHLTNIQMIYLHY